jgi:hypothetical protein
MGGMGQGAGMGSYMNVPGNMRGMLGGQNPMMNGMGMVNMNNIPANQMELAQMLMSYNNPNMFFGGFPMNMGNMPNMGGMGSMANMGMMGLGMNMANNPQLAFTNRGNQPPIANLFN